MSMVKHVFENDAFLLYLSNNVFILNLNIYKVFLDKFFILLYKK